MSDPTTKAIEKLGRELDDALDIGSFAMGDGPSSDDYARVLLAAGWVSPDEHHETLNDYGKAVGDLNLANYRLGRVEALAGELEAADNGSADKDYRLARFVVTELRAAIAMYGGTQTSGHTSPAAGGTPEAAARKGSQPAVSGTHLGT